MSKLIHTDNFGGDYPDEKFVTELLILTDKQLEEICQQLNDWSSDRCGNHQARWYKVVPDDYILQPGFEP